LKAIERLIAARQRYPEETADERQGESMAFKLALPELNSRGEIKKFIQAVAQGIALGFFNGREGSQLLYAAQIALSADTDKANPTHPRKAENFSKSNNGQTGSKNRVP
jgi:hypothetical protein